MTDILKKMKETKTPVAVYYKSSGSFYAGFVRETDGEFALLELISPCGKFDGYFCIRIEEILKLDAGTGYLENLVKVYRYRAEEIPTLKVSSKSVLEEFIDFVVKNKWLCTMEIGFETLDKISGFVAGRDWNIVEMHLLNENGLPDGYTALDLEEIVSLEVLSDDEKYLGTLFDLAAGHLKENKKESGKKGDEHVLSFPFGK